jgi:hypothetical protein
MKNITKLSKVDDYEILDVHDGEFKYFLSFLVRQLDNDTFIL